MEFFPQGDASISTVDELTTEKENELYQTTPQVSKLPIINSKRKVVGNGSGRKGSKHLVGSGTKNKPLTVLNKK